MSEQLMIVAGLVLAGYLLLAAELFVFPGFGLVGIGGLLCFGAGCIYAFRYFGMAPGSLLVVVVLISVTAILAWFPKSSFGKGVIQSHTLAAAHSVETTLSTGQRGVAESDLRPSGIARFGEIRESVVTDGDFVRSGSDVQVVEIEGARILVERASAAGPADEPGRPSSG